MIEVGDLVKIKESGHATYDALNRKLIGKMAIVVHKGTWSVDIHIIDNGQERRFDKCQLEKL
jgi:hypothetical protein